VLGIDLALDYTGLSIYTNSGIHHVCQTIEEKLSRRTKHDPPVAEPERIERMLRIANAIVGVMKIYQVRYVGLEGPAHNAKYQSHQLGEVAGIVKSQLWLNFGLAPRIVPPASARKHVIGYGGSGVSKNDIKHVVEEGLGVAVANDHEADATVVARYTFDMAVAEEEEAR
jgi:Holliday junction resolvasome RuvABC endonuclease subunit